MWAELFFCQQFFSAGKLGGAIFPPASFFCRRVFSVGEFFSANSIWVLLFFRSKENGGKPCWIFTPPLFIKVNIKRRLGIKDIVNKP
jgi:hypothetical protein